MPPGTPCRDYEVFNGNFNSVCLLAEGGGASEATASALASTIASGDMSVAQAVSSAVANNGCTPELRSTLARKQFLQLYLYEPHSRSAQ